MQHFDITIIGSGIVGATMALAVAKNNPSLQIALLDAKPISHDWQSTQYDFRVSAISLASKRIFQHLGVWDAITKKRISPYVHMYVWDESGSGEIHFDHAKIGVPVLGYIIEDSVMRTSVLEQCAQQNNISLVDAVKLSGLQQHPDYVELIFAERATLQTKLLIAADGANSWVREQLNIAMKSWDYAQTAIVATVQTTEPHNATARQRFLTTGPLAFLPLSDANTCSIVWSALHDRAAELMQLSDAEFRAQLSCAFANKLGEVISVSKRYHFPLRMRHVKHYVQDRIALIGDAAHTIHPLAGQGVNLGLLDAACLTEVITTAAQKNRNFATLATLRRYERWRKADNFAMLAGVDGLKNLFIHQNKTITALRNTGLSFVNQTHLIKNFFAAYALGNRTDLPVMAQFRV